MREQLNADYMKNRSSSLDEVELTAWVLMAIFLLALMFFSYLFWRRTCPEHPRTSQAAEAPMVAVQSVPHKPFSFGPSAF